MPSLTCRSSDKFSFAGPVKTPIPKRAYGRPFCLREKKDGVLHTHRDTHIPLCNLPIDNRCCDFLCDCSSRNAQSRKCVPGTHPRRAVIQPVDLQIFLPPMTRKVAPAVGIKSNTICRQTASIVRRGMTTADATDKSSFTRFCLFFISLFERWLQAKFLGPCVQQHHISLRLAVTEQCFQTLARYKGVTP